MYSLAPSSLTLPSHSICQVCVTRNLDTPEKVTRWQVAETAQEDMAGRGAENLTLDPVYTNPRDETEAVPN